MKEYKIPSVTLTIIEIWRRNLVTIETVKRLCNETALDLGEKGDSINDDLESLFEDLRLENEPNDYARTYFFPQLTVKELELVEKKDPTYLKNFSYSNPDVNDLEMMNSKSDSKYAQGWGFRKTKTIYPRTDDLSEN